MKILVIDDSRIHLEAAQAQLKDHDLTVASSYDQGEKLVARKHDFEVVLVDLLIPASSNQQGDDGWQFVGKEMPIGLFLALLAAKNGAKYVGLLTDTNHHCHPASACIDAFSGIRDPFIPVGEARMLLWNKGYVNDFRPENLAERMSIAEVYEERKPSVKAKNWKNLLGHLLTGKEQW